MKNNLVFKNVLNCNNPDDVFKYLIDTLKETIKSWDYFVNWKKVIHNYRDVEISLNLLNTLVGKKNIEAAALALLDEVTYYDNYVKSGEYSKSGLFTCLDKPYYEIQDKTWGIIGLGNIGKRVAKIAEAFGAKVVYYSTTGSNTNNEFKRVSFDELLNNSDIISIHAPLSKNTLGLINYESLCKMKTSSILINMGRGPIVVEKDLARAIDEGKIRGAALDVFEVEPIKINNALLTMKNKDRIILSPHIAWASVEARERLFNEVIENIRAFYNGKMRNRVDK